MKDQFATENKMELFGERENERERGEGEEQHEKGSAASATHLHWLDEQRGQVESEALGAAALLG